MVAASLAGCAFVPSKQVVPEGFAPPGTAVEVELTWDDSVATRYNHTEGGALESVMGATIEAPLTIILLPVLLPVAAAIDGGIASSNAARQRRARLLADSVRNLPDRATVAGRLNEALQDELGWVTPDPGDAGEASPPRLYLRVEPAFALRTDARALLFDVGLFACRAEGPIGTGYCSDDRWLDTRVLLHSDTMPPREKNAATRARLTAIIGELYGLEGLPEKEREQQDAARAKALRQVDEKKLSDEESILLAADEWTRDDGARLKAAFAAASRELARVLRVMREHPGPPPENSMTPTRVLFPYLYDGEMHVRDLDLVETGADGRRVLRARLEPMRAGADESANTWISVPAPTDGEHTAEKALIEFMYGFAVPPAQAGPAP